MATHLNLVAPITGSENKAATYTAIKTNDASVEDVNKASYVPNTLAGELQRIKAYIAEIGREAAFLALQAAGAPVTEDSKLDAIAEAMLSIVKNTAADASGAATYKKDADKEELTLDAGDSTTLPAGYYVNSVTVKTTSLSDQSAGTATPYDIIKGATAWVNGTKVTGLLDTDLSEKAAGNSAYKEDDNKLVIYLNEDATNSENNRTVNTGIDYVTAGDVQNKVTIKKVLVAEGADNDETAWTAESVKIPAGYYPLEINIPVRIQSDDTESGEEKVLNVTSLAINTDIDFGTAENITYRPQATNFDYYTQVSIEKAKLEKNTTTGGFTIKSPGWINTNETLAGLQEGSYDTDTITIVNTPASEGTPAKGTITISEKVHGYTPEEISLDLPVTPNPGDQTNVTVSADKNTGKASFSTTVDINAGYHTLGVVTISGEVDLKTAIPGSHTLTEESPVNDTEKAEYSNLIESQYIKDTVNKGYVTDEVKSYKVRSAVVNTAPVTTKATPGNLATITINPTTSGWFNGVTLGLEQSDVKELVDKLTTVESLTYTSTNTSTSVAIANTSGAKVTAVAGSYYDEVDMSILLADMAAV